MGRRWRGGGNRITNETISAKCRKRIRPLNRGEPDRVILETTRILMKAQDVFDPDELEERIQAHRARVKREWRGGPV